MATEAIKVRKVQTKELRDQLGDILTEVRFGMTPRVTVYKHNTPQASLIPDDHAALLYDLQEPELLKLQEAIQEFLDHKRSSKKGKKSTFSVPDALIDNPSS